MKKNKIVLCLLGPALFFMAFYSFKPLINTMLYTSSEMGGIDKFGYNDIMDTVMFRTNIKRTAIMIISISCIIAVFIKRAKNIWLFGSFITLLGYIIAIFGGTDIWMYAYHSVLTQVGFLISVTSALRYLKCAEKSINMDPLSKIYSIYYIMNNVFIVIGAGLVGFLRMYIGFYWTLSIIAFVQLVSFILINFLDNVEDDNNSFKLSSIKEDIKLLDSRKVFCSIAFIFGVGCLANTIIGSLIENIYITIVMSLMSTLLIYMSYITGLYNQIITVSCLAINIRIYRIVCDLESVPVLLWIKEFTNSKIANISFPQELLTVVNPLTVAILGPLTTYLMRIIKNRYNLITYHVFIISSFISISSMLIILLFYYLHLQAYTALSLIILYLVVFAISESIMVPSEIHARTEVFPIQYFSTIQILYSIFGIIGSYTVAYIPHHSVSTGNLSNSVFMGIGILIFNILFNFIFSNKTSLTKNNKMSKIK